MEQTDRGCIERSIYLKPDHTKLGDHEPLYEERYSCPIELKPTAPVRQALLIKEGILPNFEFG